MVLFVEWLLPAHRRPALPHARAPLDEGHARAVRRRRRDRHDPQLRDGPAVAATSWRRSASVFGLGFALEGFSFFLEAIFIAIYVYGWDRLSPRLHFLCGIPIVVAGFTGLADGDRGQRLDEPPERLPARATARPSTCIRVEALFGNALLLARARAHVRRRLHGRPASCVAGVLRRARGCAAAGAATSGPRSSIPLTVAAVAAPVQLLVGDWAARDVAEQQPIKLAAFEGLGTTTRGRADPHPRLVRRRRRQAAASRSRSCCRCSRTTTRTRRSQGLDTVPPRRPAARERRALRVPDDGRHRHAAGGARRRRSCSCACAGDGCPSRPGSTARVVAGRAAVGRRADRRLGDDRGRAPAVGRLPASCAPTQAVTGARRHPGRLRHAGGASTRCWSRRVWVLRRLARVPLAPRDPRRGGWLACSTTLPLVLRAAGPGRSTSCSAAPTSAPASGSCSPGPGERGERVRDHAHHAMAPVWEANHVWLIFVLDGAVDRATRWRSARSPRRSSIPLFIAAIGIILRGDGLRPACRARARPASSGASTRSFARLVDPDAVRARDDRRRDRRRARAGSGRRGRAVACALARRYGLARTAAAAIVAGWSPSGRSSCPACPWKTRGAPTCALVSLELFRRDLVPSLAAAPFGLLLRGRCPGASSRRPNPAASARRGQLVAAGACLVVGVALDDGVRRDASSACRRCSRSRCSRSPRSSRPWTSTSPEGPGREGRGLEPRGVRPGAGGRRASRPSSRRPARAGPGRRRRSSSGPRCGWSGRRAPRSRSASTRAARRRAHRRPSRSSRRRRRRSGRRRRPRRRSSSSTAVLGGHGHILRKPSEITSPQRGAVWGTAPINGGALAAASL